MPSHSLPERKSKSDLSSYFITNSSREFGTLKIGLRIRSGIKSGFHFNICQPCVIIHNVGVGKLDAKKILKKYIYIPDLKRSFESREHGDKKG